ncbi:MAG: hypothetical protein FWE24_09230 [Defluviitaleaceae bacterium]|nr:hypothetical protein [Defluviitaleaceae bacterium]
MSIVPLAASVLVPIGQEAEMLYFPYNSEFVQNEIGENVQDRLYDSQDWADYFRQFIGNGVYPNPASGLRVESVHNSMVLTVRGGSAFLQGRFYLQRRDFEFPVEPAHLTLGRRDIVVCRHDIIARTSQLFYIPGVPAAVPLLPQIQRTDDVFDLQLCTITVNPNAQALTQANILDTRPDNGVCGFVSGLINQVDTTSLFLQYTTYLNEQIALWEQRKSGQLAKWDEWTMERDLWTDEQRAHFEALSQEIANLVKAMETQAFSLINNNFDDWSVRRGCDKITEFNPDGSVLETIKVLALNFTLATKHTEFEGNGSILETITFNPWEVELG